MIDISLPDTDAFLSFPSQGSSLSLPKTGDWLSVKKEQGLESKFMTDHCYNSEHKKMKNEMEVEEELQRTAIKHISECKTKNTTVVVAVELIAYLYKSVAICKIH